MEDNRCSYIVAMYTLNTPSFFCRFFFLTDFSPSYIDIIFVWCMYVRITYLESSGYKTFLWVVPECPTMVDSPFVYICSLYVCFLAENFQRLGR